MVKIPLRSPPLPSTDVLITQTNVKKIALKMMKNQLYPTCHMTENGEKIRVIMKKSLVEDIWPSKDEKGIHALLATATAVDGSRNYYYNWVFIFSFYKTS